MGAGMSGNTRQRSQAIQATAMQIVARIGVLSIDAMTIGAARRIRIALQNELQATESVAYDTARRHIAKACERQRQTNWLPPPDGWGGRRK